MSARHAAAGVYAVDGRLELRVDDDALTVEAEVELFRVIVDKLNESRQLVDQLDAMARQLRGGAAAAGTRRKRRQLLARAEGVELARNTANTYAERITSTP